MNFCCPDCHDTRLEEIMTDVLVASEITIEDGEVCYGEQTNEDGIIDRFQCATCGHVLKENGVAITTHEDLIRLLETP